VPELNPLATANLDINDGQLIRIVRDAKLATRADLVEATGWARSTVSRRIDALVDLGVLATPGEAKSSGGRPPSLLRFNGDAGSILAADLGISHSRVAAVNLVGDPIGPPTDIELDLS
jgi:glucokinase